MIMRRMALSVTLGTSLWPARLAALLLSAAAAASAAYWALKLSGPAPGPAVAAVQAPEATLDTGLVARALGGAASDAGVASAAGAPVPVAESARFVLMGVVDQQAGGAALIGVDGKAAKPVAVGAAVADGWMLRAVQGRSATLERSGAQLLLELPPRVKG